MDLSELSCIILFIYPIISTGPCTGAAALRLLPAASACRRGRRRGVGGPSSLVRGPGRGPGGAGRGLAGPRGGGRRRGPGPEPAAGLGSAPWGGEVNTRLLTLATKQYCNSQTDTALARPGQAPAGTSPLQVIGGSLSQNVRP